jgi:hypothetical protein
MLSYCFFNKEVFSRVLEPIPIPNTTSHYNVGLELWMQFYVGLEKYMEWNATTMLIFMLEAECKP